MWKVDLRGRGYLGGDWTNAAPSDVPVQEALMALVLLQGAQPVSKRMRLEDKNCWHGTTFSLFSWLPAWGMVLRKILQLDSARKCFLIHCQLCPWARKWKWTNVCHLFTKLYVLEHMFKRVKDHKIKKEWKDR